MKKDFQKEIEKWLLPMKKTVCNVLTKRKLEKRKKKLSSLTTNLLQRKEELKAKVNELQAEIAKIDEDSVSKRDCFFKLKERMNNETQKPERNYKQIAEQIEKKLGNTMRQD